VVARLNAACNEALAQPEIKARLLELGVTTTPGTPAQYQALVREQVAALAPLVRTIRVTL
jgi:tripartite-type tricarboxylate transporter receptor subunit TctC